jgi:multiple sugar transport system ATP-binding protein
LFVDAEVFRLRIPADKVPYYRQLAGSEVIFGIRPYDIYAPETAPERCRGITFRAVIEVVEMLGPEYQLNLSVGKHNITACVDVNTSARVHDEIELVMDLGKMHLFETQHPNHRIKAEA